MWGRILKSEIFKIKKGSKMKKLILGILLCISFSTLIAGEYNISDKTSHLKLDLKTVYENEKVLVTLKVKNLYKNGKGGISLSFPQFSKRTRIISKNKKGFSKVDVFNSGSKIWNKHAKKALPSKYLLVEGWSNTWKKNEIKELILEIDTKKMSSLIIQTRGNLISNKKKLAIPNKGNTGQQGYEVLVLQVPLANSGTKNKNLSSKVGKKYIEERYGEGWGQIYEGTVTSSKGSSHVLKITGDGKAGGFLGTLEVHCSPKKYTWKKVVLYGWEDKTLDWNKGIVSYLETEDVSLGFGDKVCGFSSVKDYNEEAELREEEESYKSYIRKNGSPYK
jgi:hypothetical protein